LLSTGAEVAAVQNAGLELVVQVVISQSLDLIVDALGAVLYGLQGIAVIGGGVAGDVGGIDVGPSRDIEVGLLGTLQLAPGLLVALTIGVNEVVSVVVIGDVDLLLLTVLHIPEHGTEGLGAVIILIPTIGQQNEGVVVGLDEQADIAEVIQI